MASLDGRISRLEGRMGGDNGLPCPECGWPRVSGDDDNGAAYEVVFDDEDEDPASPEPAFCETCGERIPEIVFPDQFPSSGRKEQRRDD